ncbi:MAG: rhamnulokinase [Bacteroidaceae bacterium]|nr:rhamnulokinase [Bacteroidaceae bacterium]
MKKKSFFSVDLGASSGRTIIGTLSEAGLELRELTRFENPIIEVTGHFYWDIYALYHEIIKALKIVAKEGTKIESIGIDTWGVDFALVCEDGELLRQPYSYRDSHTADAPEIFFSKSMPCEKLYELTGIQIMNFNSVFQLDAIRRNHPGMLEQANKILFIPDALSFMLTGTSVTEYTIASTSQMLNPKTKKFEKEILDVLGLRDDQFAPLIYPGECIGHLTAAVQRQTGLGSIPVVAVAGHDTASAVAAVPASEGEHFAYISSGTWSLMGVELNAPVINQESFAYNFTNEGGVDGTVRFLKNICGMWLLESCRREWELEHNYSYGELIEMALRERPFESLINPDASCFANPTSMVEAIRNYCVETKQDVPKRVGQIVRCIFDSLALRYRQVFERLQGFAPFAIEAMHVIGGGSQNALLNQFTANSLGVKVIAGPKEATAIGNVMLQAKAAGMVNSIAEMRSTIRNSMQFEEFTPAESVLWEKAYTKYLAAYREDL